MYASYSPDGSKIIFQTSGTEPLIKISRDDGSDVRVGTAGSDPSWTLDGRSIVFLRRFTDEINFRNNSTVWLEAVSQTSNIVIANPDLSG